MTESPTQPQSDVPSEIQPAITEPLLSEAAEPEPAAKWWMNRSAQLLIGGPLAGALLVWLGISIFGSKPDTEPAEVTQPAAVTEQAAPEPVSETQTAVETSAPSAAEGQAEAEPAQAAAAAPPPPPPAVDPEPPLPKPYVPQTAAISEIIPTVPQSALNTISGTVRVTVRVTVDKGGNVIESSATDPGPSRYFERLSVDAAKKWTFAPADLEDQRAMLVKFNFTKEGVTATANPEHEPN